MDTRRRNPLPEDSSGVRPGHPKAGQDRMECVDAASAGWLNTTPQTVRTLIERGDLDGYWHRVGKVYQFWPYRQAVEQFIASYGRYPAARHQLASRRRLLSGGNQHRHRQRQSAETSKLHLRILGLQETVRCQSAVIQKLQLAMQAQEAVADHLRKAEDAGARAATLVREANDEYHRLVSLEGIPDDPSTVIPTA